MTTLPTPHDIARAADFLRTGGLVAFPTETVYGLGAHAFDERAVARVFEVKGRPRFDPLIVHVARQDDLSRLVSDIPETAWKLAARFWPGPLTLVLPKRPVVPDLVTAGCPTVAVRIPDHPVALELLRAADVPVAAPSANLFGRISPTTADHVREQFDDRIDLILDGGPCRVGVESTVLQLTTEGALLLRPGGTPVEDIESVIGTVTLAPRASTASEAASGLASPGTLSQHYAPRTPLVIRQNAADCGLGIADCGLPQTPTGREFRDQSAFETRSSSTNPQSAIRNPQSEPRTQDTVLGTPPPSPLAPPSPPRAGLLAFLAPADAAAFAAVEVLSPGGDLREAAANLFAALRRLDAAGLDLIVAEALPNHGLGLALNDRLERAQHR